MGSSDGRGAAVWAVILGLAAGAATGIAMGRDDIALSGSWIGAIIGAIYYAKRW